MKPEKRRSQKMMRVNVTLVFLIKVVFLNELETPYTMCLTVSPVVNIG